LDGHSVRPRSLNVSALPVQIIQKFFAASWSNAQRVEIFGAKSLLCIQLVSY
jgi:hypothetical protein